MHFFYSRIFNTFNYVEFRVLFIPCRQRAAKSICVGYSQDEWFNGKARRQRSFLDTSGGAARRRYKRRLSWGGFSVSDDEKLSRSIILFTPFANRCDNCNKWTVFRCKRCNSKFFCCRSCQQEVSFPHDLCSPYLIPIPTTVVMASTQSHMRRDTVQRSVRVQQRG